MYYQIDDLVALMDALACRDMPPKERFKEACRYLSIFKMKDPELQAEYELEMQEAVDKVLKVISVKNPKVIAIPGPGRSEIWLDYRHRRKSLKEIDEWLAQLDLKLNQKKTTKT
jgi:hypothetical protein